MATSLMQTAEDLAKKNAYTATTQDFDESKGVAGRVNSLISSGSPLMKTAQTRAAQEANARGLRNSSMAVQAGQQAVIETATPIASNDAQLYQNQTLANQNALNTAKQFNSGQATNAGMQGMQLDVNQNQFGQSLKENQRQFGITSGLQAKQLAQQNQQFGSELALRKSELQQQATLEAARLKSQETIAKMDSQSRLDMMKLEASYKKEIESNTNIANAWGTMMQSIDNIQNNPELSASTKKALIQNNINGFQSFTSFWQKVSGGKVNVSDLLKFKVTSTSAPKKEAEKEEEEKKKKKEDHPYYWNTPSDGA